MNIFRKEGKIECDFDLDFLLDLDDLLSIDPIFSFINFLHLSLPSSKSEQMRSRASLEYPDIKLTIPSIDCFVHFFSSTETNVPFIQSLNFQKLLKQKKFREISGNYSGNYTHQQTNGIFLSGFSASVALRSSINRSIHLCFDSRLMFPHLATLLNAVLLSSLTHRGLLTLVTPVSNWLVTCRAKRGRHSREKRLTQCCNIVMFLESEQGETFYNPGNEIGQVWIWVHTCNKCA